MAGLDEFFTRTCTQVAVYWGNPQEDGYGGKTFDTAAEIYCRWEQGGEMRRTEVGEIEVSYATVYVLQDLDEKGLLYLGTLDDLDSAEEENPETINGVYEIKKFEKIPALGSTTSFLRKALL